jgi:hypothetical protein
MRISISSKIELLHEPYLHKKQIFFRHINDIKSKDDSDAVILPKYANRKDCKIPNT